MKWKTYSLLIDEITILEEWTFYVTYVSDVQQSFIY